MLWKWWQRTIIAVTAIGAVVASFIFLTDLAMHAGWPESVAPLLPLCIDALAAMALTQYRLTGRVGPGIVAVAAIIFSAVGNAASHWFSSGLLEPGWLAITIVGVVPAIALGLVVHLSIPRGNGELSIPPKDTKGSVGVRDHGIDSSPTVSGQVTTTQNHPKASRPTGTARTASATGTGRVKRTDDDLLRQIRENHWTTESATKLVGLLGISKTRALRVRKLLQPVENDSVNVENSK